MSRSLSDCSAALRPSADERWLRAGRLAHFLRAGLLALAVLLGGSPSLIRADIVDTFVETWKGQQSEIATARVRFRLFQSRDVTPLPRREVQQLFRTGDLGADPERLKGILNKALPQPMETPWVLQRIFQQGSQIKNEVVGQRFTIADDGAQRVEYNGLGFNNQALLYPLGVSTLRIWSVRDLRRTPGPDSSLYRLASRGAGQVVLKAPIGEIVVDETNGAVLRASWRDRADAREVTHEWLQDCFVTYPSGISFPSLNVQAEYGPGELLRQLEVTWIEEADFNINLGAGAFAVSAPAGCNVFDRREPTRPWNWRSERPVLDVVEATDERLGTSIASVREPSSRVGWLSVGAGLGLLGLCMGLWLRWRKSVSGV